MSGVEKIIKSIEEDVNIKISGIFKEADIEILKIKKKYEEKARKEVLEIINDSKIESDLVLRKVKSLSKNQRNKNILKVKKDLVHNSIEKAEEYLKNLPDDKYFSVILKLIEKFSHLKEGEIVFSQKDLKRLPNDFENQIKRKNNKLSISKNTKNIDSGFIIVRGFVQENCTFNALFNSLYDKLCDDVAKFYFGNN
ncbi:MAG: hypothetical protein LBT82_01660 [Oscillospiraceae bacterium]|nr:hypothetical protein [Oscillospiraceae bacterium]